MIVVPWISDSALALNGSGSVRHGSNASSISEQPLPVDKLCGRHSLFILLRLLGYDIPYSEIERVTPVGPKGSSLLQLRKAAEDLGIRLIVNKCHPKNLAAVRNSCCIVLIRSRAPEKNAEKVMLEGHYVVTEPPVHVNEENKVNIFDSAFNCRESLADEDFSSIWTGYYLSPPPSYANLGIVQTTLAFVMCALAVTAWRLQCRSHNSPTTKREA
jgi:ABC-type bacteriocin/lantibiotic exporter with double-glycine peptidase domain